jgi:hypothetical protein
MRLQGLASVLSVGVTPVHAGERHRILTFGGRKVWHGVSEFLLLALIVGAVLHALNRRYVLCTFGSAALCSMLNLVHEAWVANWQVNLGWGPPMFVIGALLALPICAVAGIPWLALRRWRKRAA